jgi:hypothetical protein
VWAFADGLGWNYLQQAPGACVNLYCTIHEEGSYTIGTENQLPACTGQYDKQTFLGLDFVISEVRALLSVSGFSCLYMECLRAFRHNYIHNLLPFYTSG